MTVSPLAAQFRIALAAVLANATWFSATAVGPALEQEWRLTGAGAAALVVAVQLGFITGSVGAALLNLPDRLEARWLIAGSCCVAAMANAGLLLAHGVASALPSRLLVGVALAGVYGPCVRLVSTYFPQRRGASIGLVVGALTLGSASPHLLNGLGAPAWQSTILGTSVLAVIGAWIIRPVMAGPVSIAAPPLDLSAARRSLRDRSVRLVAFGYLGHMWELYALWAWLPAFFVASRETPSRLETGIVAFGAVGVAGFVGAAIAGRVADRYGRTLVTISAMTVSAAGCLVSPFAFELPTVLLVAVLGVWGAAAIADSAQFSAAVTELAEPQYSGSALTLQLALGFALTIASIRLVPAMADFAGWRFALAPLALGPLLGAISMFKLRGSPASLLLAGGRR